MLLMVCSYPKLDGTNVPHGLGVLRGISWCAIGFFHGLKFSVSEKNSPRQKSYVGIRKNTAFQPTNQTSQKIDRP
jgi:hypothetical protein